MFTGTVIGLLVAASAATWVYTKALRHTGGNTKSALVVAVIAGLFTFFIVLTVVSMIDSSLAN